METTVYLSIGEQEMVRQLQVTGASYIAAVNCVLDHKTRLLEHYRRIGYDAMAEQLTKELGLK